MHPAFSIIFFTTVSGLGYGLAAVLGFGLFDPSAVATKVAHVLALVLIAAGLLSSTLHLGNPQRAWRAFSQWRSSWLSREGVAAVATFAPLTVNAFAVVFLSRDILAAGLLGSLGAAVTVYCTAMIYGSLRSVQAWNTRLTPLSYLLLSGAGGLLLAACFASVVRADALAPLLALALAFLAAAWLSKLAWRNRLKRLVPLSTPESATGLGSIGRVRLFEAPHVNDNYLTREMGYRIARKHADKLAAIAMLLGGVLPASIVVAVLGLGQAGGAVPALALGMALAAFSLALLVERWLFFAEARHAVMNYYGR